MTKTLAAAAVAAAVAITGCGKATTTAPATVAATTTAPTPTTAVDPCDPAVIGPMRAEAEAEHQRRLEDEQARHGEQMAQLNRDRAGAKGAIGKEAALALALGYTAAGQTRMDKAEARLERALEAIDDEESRHADRLAEIEDWAYDLLRSPSSPLGQCPATGNVVGGG